MLFLRYSSKEVKRMKRRKVALLVAATLMISTVVPSTALAIAPTKTVNFALNVLNTATGNTSLQASIADPVLSLINSASGAALDLQTKQGTAPMTVNSNAKVDNLNADYLDDKDINEVVGAGLTTYELSTYVVPIFNNNHNFGGVRCNAGDKALSGGVQLDDAYDETFESSTPWRSDNGTSPDGWRASWYGDPTGQVAGGALIYVVCAKAGS